MSNPYPGKGGTVVLWQIRAAAKYHGHGIGTVFLSHHFVKLL